MPETLSPSRMAEAEGLGRDILWEPWIDLPQWVQDRFGLREWNNQMKRRDEINRSKIDDELRRMRKDIQ